MFSVVCSYPGGPTVLACERKHRRYYEDVPEEPRREGTLPWQQSSYTSLVAKSGHCKATGLGFCIGISKDL